MSVKLSKLIVLSVRSLLLSHPVCGSAVSGDLVQSSPLLRSELLCCSYFVAKQRNIYTTNARSSTGPPNCNIGRIATSLPKRGIKVTERMHRHGLKLVSATCDCPGLLQPVCALSFSMHQSPPVSLCVILIKQVCMRSATLQLSETEMSFDFHNPVSSVHSGFSTHMLTEQECSVKANTIVLCRSANKNMENVMAVYSHAQNTLGR